MRSVAIEFKPLLAVPHHDSILAQFDRRLAVAVQSMRRGVAAEQGSERDPELNPKRAGGWFIQISGFPSGAKAPVFLCLVFGTAEAVPFQSPQRLKPRC